MGPRILVVLVPLVLLAVVTGAVRVVGSGRLDPAAARARRRSAVTTAGTALAAGFVVAVPAPVADDVRFATLPAAAATAGIIASAAAERRWPRPTGPTRTASLTAARVVRGVGPTRNLRRLYAVGLGVAAVVLVVGALSAGPDGRSVTRYGADWAAASSPYPGAAYGVPVGIALALLAVATWWALLEVDARPVLPKTPLELDRAVRLASRVRVLRYAAAGALATAAGLTVTAGVALGSLARTVRVSDATAPRVPWDWTQNSALALVGVGLACTVGALVALLWRAPQVPGVEPEVEREAAAGVAAGPARGSAAGADPGGGRP